MKSLFKYLVLINLCFPSQAFKSTNSLCDNLEEGVVSLGKKQSRLEVSQGLSLEKANSQVDIITAKIAILKALQKLKSSKFPEDQIELNKLLETTNSQVTEVFRRRHSMINANQTDSSSPLTIIDDNSKESKSFHLQKFIRKSSDESCTSLFNNISELNGEHSCITKGLRDFTPSKLEELKKQQKVLKGKLSKFAQSSNEFQDLEKLKYLSISRMRKLECTNGDGEIFLNPYIGTNCFSYKINSAEDKSLDDLVEEMHKIKERALAENYYQDLGLGSIQKNMSNSQTWKSLKAKYCTEDDRLIDKSICSTLTLRITDIDHYESPKKIKLDKNTTRYWDEGRQEMSQYTQHPSKILSYAAQYAASTLVPSTLNDFFQYRNFKSQIPFWESALTQQINMTNYFTQRLNSCQDSQQMWCNPYAGSYSIYTPTGFNFNTTAQ